MFTKLAALFHSKLVLALLGATLLGGGAAVANASGATSGLTTAFNAQNSPHAAATHTPHAQQGDDDQQHGGQDHDLDGSVTSINTAGSSFVVTVMREDKTSSALTVKVNAATTFAGNTKSFADLKVGMYVEADGTTQSDGSFLATKVAAWTTRGDDDQHEAEVSGSVVTVGTTSFTIKGEQGTMTIAVSSATVYEGGVKSLADLKAGMPVEVTGVKQSDGSIAAQHVTTSASNNPGDD